MPYNNAIPQPNDQLSVSQNQILANFQALSPFGNGFAIWQFTATAAVIVGPTTMGTYSNTGTTSAQQELFLKRNAGTTYPASIRDFAFTEAGVTNPGWTRLPSGIMFKWGGPTLAGVAINLNATGPAFTAAFAATLGQTAGVPNHCFINTLTAANLLFISNPAGGSAFWFVIGY